jgi:Peptidase family M41/ATPase family associated with various cellular activities (AAA)
MEVNFLEIAARKQILEDARIQLKQHFVGIDETIDDLFNYIQIWYLMPEVLTRPIIVNLWGMTGIGKTDLVRRLVKCLSFQDRFVEIELSNVDSTSWASSVSRILDDNGIVDSKPAIVLFDEIQRFNTLNADGSAIETTKFMDFWELLSDGRLSKKTRENIDRYLQDFLYQQKDLKRRKDRGDENVDENPMLEFYEAQNIKSMLQLEDDVSDIAGTSKEQIIEQLKSAKNKKKIYEPIDYSQTLIIISGNLDEAFAMANQIAESDVDADIFHAFTRKVTMVDIKNALSRKFRPEQVARFGNIHLIYKSLRKQDFEQLIRNEVDRIIDSTLSRFGVSLTVEDPILELIYRNGVFPVQGVRPVFSSIVDILETNVSKFLFTALLNGQENISIDYDFTKLQILSKIGEIEEVIPFVGRIDKIRQSNLQDTITNISVHEAGHAVAYIVLFGLAPLQLKSKLANSYAGGFTFPHEIYETQASIVNKIKVYLAGGIAEEVVFGKSLASVGRSHDREQATVLTIEYIRKYGFDEKFQANYVLDDGYSMDKSTTDLDIEQMITRLVAETQEILTMHKTLLYSISLKLAAVGSLEAIEVAAIASEYGIITGVQAEGYLQIPNYEKILNEGKSV